MNNNSSDYFSYKKNKIQQEIEKPKKSISKAGFLLQLFIATFVVMFIVLIIGIMKYSAKMDIEYTQGELQVTGNALNTIPNYINSPSDDEPQRKIDKRLIKIQQEENAPSEAKVIKNENHHNEIISHTHLENSKKIEKKEKLEKQKKLNEQQTTIFKSIPKTEEVILQKKIIEEPKPEPIAENVTIMSKVLIGRYTTFDEAKNLQDQIKLKNPALQPFVQKVGNVYSVQMGSYQNFAVARNHAQTLKANGFDVWIYQQ